MTDERSVLSVGELNQRADEILRAGFGSVWVEGEVSNLRQYASGHRYFSLKDDHASISCTLFRGRAGKAAPFADGDRVRVFARPGVYVARGQFQLVVESLESAGEGRLLAEFQRLKARLLAEGLFDPGRKRPLPPLVHRLGVITSAQGDVRHDIARTLARRFPLLLPFRLYPVAVQGAGAAPRIVAALEEATRDTAVDVLILARGGGALEDLWAFNEEAVARAIAACPIPVVTGIGHETDTTIADFVADLRASTPTAAAEAVSPDGAVLGRQLHDAAARLGQAATSGLRERRQRVEQARSRLQQVHPGRRLEQHLLRLDELRGRLIREVSGNREKQLYRLRQLALRLKVHDPARRLQTLRSQLRQQQHRLWLARPSRQLVRLQDHLEGLHGRLLRATRDRVRRDESRLQAASGRLQALSPEGVLERGYSILLTADQRVVRQADPALVGTQLHARLARGALELTVLDAEPPKKGPGRKRQTRG